MNRCKPGSPALANRLALTGTLPTACCSARWTRRPRLEWSIDTISDWLVAADGGTFSDGDVHFFGSAGSMHFNAPAVDLASTGAGGTPTRRGAGHLLGIAMIL